MVFFTPLEAVTQSFHKSLCERPKSGSFFCITWEQRKLWAITIWDKNFNEVDKEKQPKIIKYPYVLADVFKQIEDNTGDIRLLSSAR